MEITQGAKNESKRNYELNEDSEAFGTITDILRGEKAINENKEAAKKRNLI